ncbi:4'-phosphopantetheinyl transferase superfamily protein [Streptomyces albogriseolus]|uniref:4'-phosphopantetheinyl transferase superfamily protein n=1 Tax=Streptomyces albogriseolus TaxID=1887 RepID=UPI00382F49C0
MDTDMDSAYGADDTTPDLDPDRADRHRSGRDQADVVHLWYIDLDAVSPGAGKRLDSALGPEERARRGTYPDSRSRSRFTVAHGALRILLGRFLGIPAPQVRMRCGPLGKPSLPPGAPPVHFSLSHARGQAVAAVSVGREVGVDLDHPRDGFPLEEFTRRYFPPPERDLVLGAPRGDRQRVFLTLWTRKEALVKAAGSGIAVGVRQQVGVAADATVVTADHPRMRGTWRIADLSPPLGVGAVALAHSRPYRVVAHNWAAAEAPWTKP